jgi:hypothetical protein
VESSPSPIPLDSYGPRRYHLINNGTRLGNTSWRGRVVIGVEAIYIFKESLEQFPVHPHDALAAVVGILYGVTAIFAKRAKPALDIPGVSYFNISQSVTDHPAWPIHQPTNGQVVIIPRSSVSILHRDLGAAEMEFAYDGVPIAVRWGFFDEITIKKFLIATGWPLRWQGPLYWTGKLYNIDRATASRLAKPSKPRIGIASFVVALSLAILSWFSEQLPPDFRGIAYFTLIGAAFVVGLFGVAALRRGI